MKRKRKDTDIKVRVSKPDKKLLRAAATASGFRSLSKWILSTCMKAATNS